MKRRDFLKNLWAVPLIAPLYGTGKTDKKKKKYYLMSKKPEPYMKLNTKDFKEVEL
jgi:hypothetical protein